MGTTPTRAPLSEDLPAGESQPATELWGVDVWRKGETNCRDRWRAGNRKRRKGACGSSCIARGAASRSAAVAVFRATLHLLRRSGGFLRPQGALPPRASESLAADTMRNTDTFFLYCHCFVAPACFEPALPGQRGPAREPMILEYRGG